MNQPTNVSLGGARVPKVLSACAPYGHCSALVALALLTVHGCTIPTEQHGSAPGIWIEDAEGRWVNTYVGEGLYGQPKFKAGDRYIHSGVFSRNLETLSRFVSGSANE